MTLDQLRTTTRRTTTSTGTDKPCAPRSAGTGNLISIPDLLRLAAEAEIVPVVLNNAGGVLAYGRTRRLATRAQRLALAARDRGCSMPGCTRPATWCQVHHVTPWQQGGATDLNNLTLLLCGHHHREFEKHGWACEMFDGVPHWIPPTWLDPDQTPRRNTAHHADVDFSRFTRTETDRWCDGNTSQELAAGSRAP